jgi:CopG family nickel-responsive transcriptional regulator
LTNLQHEFHKAIISTLHVHLDQQNCLEVLVIKGKGNELKKMSDRLIGTKGVKHGNLSLTTTGKNLD